MSKSARRALLLGCALSVVLAAPALAQSFKVPANGTTTVTAPVTSSDPVTAEFDQSGAQAALEVGSTGTIENTGGGVAVGSTMADWSKTSLAVATGGQVLSNGVAVQNVATVDNQGLIQGSMFGVNVGPLPGDVLIENRATGTIEATGGTALVAIDDPASSFGVKVVNQGLIQGAGSGAVLLAPKATLGNTGQIIGQGGYGVEIAGSGSNSIDNSGVISGALGGLVVTDIGLGGQTVIKNAGTIAISDPAANADRFAVGLFDDTSILNDGVISALGDAHGLLWNSNSTITNSIDGAILVEGGAALYAFGGSGTVTNAGMIESGSGPGIYVDEFSNLTSITNEKSGSIVSNAFAGLYIEGKVATITNAGLIEGDEAGVAFVNNVVLGDLTTELTNTGTIRGGLDGVVMIGEAVGTLTNSGLIEGVTGAGVYANGGTPTIVNSGTIRGPEWGLYAGFDTSAITIQNSGTIDTGFAGGTAIAVESADTTLTNTGQILGSVFLGDGDDTITVSGGGAIVGDTFLGGGLNQITIGGTGAGTIGTIFGGDGGDLITFLNEASIDGDINLGGQSDVDDQLVFAAGSTGTFEVETVAGVERAIFNGTWSIDANFSGPTLGELNSGVLTFGGWIESLDVKAGRLTGDGYVDDLTVVSGVFAPGVGVGAFSTGDLTFSGPAAIFEVEVKASGESDVATSTGAVALGGASLSVKNAGGSFALSKYSYDILTAAGGVTGQFGPLLDDLAFYSVDLDYFANKVTLNLLRNQTDFGDVAATPNQEAVGEVLDDNVLTPGLEAITDPMAFLTVAGAQEALGELAGELNAAAPRLAFDQSRSFQDALGRRNGGSGLGGIETASLRGRVEVASLDGSAAGAAGGDAAETGAWVEVTGDRFEAESSPAFAGYEGRSTGLSAGVDHVFASGARIGAAVGLSNGELDMDGGDGLAETDSVHLGAHAAWQTGRWRLSGAASVGWNAYETEREIGFLNQTASAEFDATSWAVQAEAAWSVNGSAMHAFDLLGGIDAAGVSTDGYAETGAGAANLTVESSDDTWSRLRIGAEVRTDYAAMGADWGAVARVQWAHDLSALDTGREVALQALPGDSFLIDAQDLDENALLLDFALKGQISERLALGFGYAGEFRGDARAHRLHAGLRLRW